MTDEELEDFKKMFENPETIYVSKEDYDTLVEQLGRKPKPIPSLIELLNRKTPFKIEENQFLDEEVEYWDEIISYLHQEMLNLKKN